MELNLNKKEFIIKWKKYNKSLYHKFLKIIGFTKDKTSRNLFKLFQFAFYSVLIVFTINLFSIGKSGFGEWGDFFGGVLNPVLTFLTFMGLLITIILQQKELQQSRKEFKGQKESLENQEFDNKFFQMLNLLNNIILNLSSSGEKGKKVFNFLIYRLVEDLKIPDSPYVNKQEHNLKRFKQYFEIYNDTYDTSFKYYFLNLYQILNYIKKNSSDEYILKEYTNIVRAQLSKNELILLFFNGIGVIQFSGNSYKNIIEDYALFEHLTYSDLTKFSEVNKDTCMYHLKDLVNILLVEYKETAFGNNIKLIEERNKLLLNNDNKLLEEE